VSLRPPFPWYGGKRRVAPEVWARFGDVRHYVEPFAGGLAVLLGRPEVQGHAVLETVNDRDRYVANFWRAVRADPEAVAHHADWPVNEVDLRARHRWLVAHAQDLVRLDDDPDAFDAKIAGWWVWGVCSWVGGGWCAEAAAAERRAGREAHLGRASGLALKRPMLLTGKGVHSQRPCLDGGKGLGVARPVGSVAEAAGECAERRASLLAACLALADRLRGVRVCCGDWSRVVTDAVVGFPPEGPAGVFFDPPYAAEADRAANIYAQDSLTVAHAVRARALEIGADPRMRVALCGYEEEHGPHMPSDWSVYAWSANGGAQRRNGGASKARANRHRERIWFSPACLSAEVGPLFSESFPA
jgi:DNA adenine methylase